MDKPSLDSTFSAMESQIATVKSFIKANWNNTVRMPESQSPSEIPLPEPFNVSTIGSHFQIFSYWETFFICEGLLRDGHLDLAIHNTNNILYLIDTLGFVPNCAMQSARFCSQPPIAALLVEKIFIITQDKTWLQKALSLLIKEYSFWHTFRSGPQNLNHFGWHGYPADLDQFAWSIHDRLVDIPEDPLERKMFQAHALAEVESGWEFTPRYKRHCADFYAIDLNCFLFMYESIIANIYDLLDIFSGGAIWRKRALHRRTLINKYCWNDENGFFYDYDYRAGEILLVDSAAAFLTLWAGIASIEQAAKITAKLASLEYKFGIVACCPESQDSTQSDQNSIYLWDFPYALPPIQYAAMAGCLRYGFLDDAARIAKKYIACVTKNFLETGNFWQSYNAVTGGIHPQDNGASHLLLGWTAGTYLFASDIIKQAEHG